VENTGNDSKQDCELKAFYRMAKKINAYFPRLPQFCHNVAASGFGREDLKLTDNIKSYSSHVLKRL